MCGAEGLRRVQDTEVPSALLTECHPQREDTQAAVAVNVPAVAAVETSLVEGAETEPAAVRAEGISANPVTVDRSALALALEVRENETGDKRGRAERSEVLLGQGVLLAKLGEYLDLLFGIL